MTNSEPSSAQSQSSSQSGEKGLTIPDSYPYEEEVSTPIIYGKGQRWAVLVGINTYEDHNYYGTLSVSIHDAEAIHATLLQSGDFDRKHVHLLTDQETRLPSKGNILATLQAVAKATDPDDLFLFYFSGHGEEHDGESYLVPKDGRGIVLTDTGVPMKRVKEIMEGAQARAKVIMLDACHSGAKIGAKGAQPMSAEFIYHTFEQAAGIAIISSCVQGQLSYEWPEQQCSAFTYYLLEALQGVADRDKKGFVTVQDVNHHVIPSVRLWASLHQLNQTPKLNYDVIGDIILTHYTKQDNIRHDSKANTSNTPMVSKSKIADPPSNLGKPASILDTHINDYIGDIQALREGRVHQELTDRLAATGAIKPGPVKQTDSEDILERYRNIPLHALFLYTSEDADVHTYITQNWKALASLSANNCDIYPMLTQFNNSEDAYDFMEQIDVLRQSKARPAYSDLPGIFFWDNYGDSTYISFGLLVNQTTIRNSLRVIFEEVRREPRIAAVRRANNILKGEDGNKMSQSAMARERTIVFIGYHPKEVKYLKELHTFLDFYESQGSFHTWDDTKILPGMRHMDETNKAVQSAKVVILLLSPDFLISDFMRNQLPQLLPTVKRNEVVILPVIARRCFFKETPLAPFKPVNDPDKPLSAMNSEERDDTWMNVTQQVKDLLNAQD